MVLVHPLPRVSVVVSHTILFVPNFILTNHPHYCLFLRVAFALYGLLVLGVLGDFQGGVAFADYAMDLVGRIKDDEYSFAILIASITKSNVKPISGLMKEYLVGYQAGMEKGDGYYAIHNICNYLLSALLIGRPLDFVNDEMQRYFPHFVEYGQLSSYRRGLPIWQLVKLLMTKIE